MEHLVIGLYTLSLIACCVGLWLWYEIDSNNEIMEDLRSRMRELDGRVDELERRKR